MLHLLLLLLLLPSLMLSLLALTRQLMRTWSVYLVCRVFCLALVALCDQAVR